MPWVWKKTKAKKLFREKGFKRFVALYFALLARSKKPVASQSEARSSASLAYGTARLRTPLCPRRYANFLNSSKDLAMGGQ